MFVIENPKKKNYNNQAMCSYFQSDQCHSIGLLNLLITSQEIFPVFRDTICELHHILLCLNLDL